MKPHFESPVHTASDLVERNITLYMSSGSQLMRQLLTQSDIPEYRKIAETIFFSNNINQFDIITRNELLSRGTHAQLKSAMSPLGELGMATEYDHDQGKYKYNSGRGYHRGERVVLAGLIPSGGYLSNKKWHLNEVQNNALTIL